MCIEIFETFIFSFLVELWPLAKAKNSFHGLLFDFFTNKQSSSLRESALYFLFFTQFICLLLGKFWKFQLDFPSNFHLKFYSHFIRRKIVSRK